MTVEFRAWFGDDAEVRAAAEGMSFTGYAIRYNAKSEPLPFTETIAPGAVTRSLKSRNEIKAFVNHDTNLVIGSTRAGTLRLTDDERGVLADIDLPDVTYARDLAENVRVGNVSGMSFGFSVVKDKWSEDYSERTIHELRLHEVSVVTGFPAYRQTTAAVRALPLLAKRTGIDIDALSDAFDALSEGSLNDDQYALLVDAADRARPERPAVEPEPVDLSALQALSDLLKKRDDL
jgi:uncharacterized protein